MERMDELEEMRSQIAILKNKLSKESIVNDKLFNTVIKTNKGLINKFNIVEYAGCAFVIVWSLTFLPHFGMSRLFIIGTIVLILACAAATAMINWKVRTTDFTTENMLEAAKEFKKLKNRYKYWIIIGFPLAAAWAAWFFSEIWNRLPDKKMAMGMIAGGCVGGVVGAIIDLSMNRRVMKACDEVIYEIEN